ncbi:hypothetical protein D9M73_150640 [compost metagenome]
MRFSVSVPVLSVHSTVADPKVSIAAARRVSTPTAPIRHAPIARKMVRTTGNSSGSIDMPIAIPARIASIQPPRSRPNSTTTANATAPPPIAHQVTMRVVSRWSRGASVSSVASDWPILPISLRGPVAVTSAMPLPRATSVPE